MLIKKTIKLPDGVELTANLNEEQVSFLLGIAINLLMAQGAVPFTMTNDETNMDFHTPPDSMN
jgi:hypothetical protein